jgi:hypothetical protein
VRGGFLGIDLDEPTLDADERTHVLAIAKDVGGALAEVGYTGPYGIDGFVYRIGEQRKLHPICEINARYTFGHVARALHARFGTKTLGFGTPPNDARVLVAASAEDPVTAWVA